MLQIGVKNAESRSCLWLGNSYGYRWVISSLVWWSSWTQTKWVVNERVCHMQLKRWQQCTCMSFVCVFCWLGLYILYEYIVLNLWFYLQFLGNGIFLMTYESDHCTICSGILQACCVCVFFLLPFFLHSWGDDGTEQYTKEMQTVVWDITGCLQVHVYNQLSMFI